MSISSSSSENKKPRQSSLPPLRVSPCRSPTSSSFTFTPPRSPKSPISSTGSQIHYTAISPKSPQSQNSYAYYPLPKSPTHSAKSPSNFSSTDSQSDYQLPRSPKSPSNFTLHRQFSKSSNYDSPTSDYYDQKGFSQPKVPKSPTSYGSTGSQRTSSRTSSYYSGQKSPNQSYESPRSPNLYQRQMADRSPNSNYSSQNFSDKQHRPERPQSVNFTSQKSPKSPRQIFFKSPSGSPNYIDGKSPQNGTGNYFNFNITATSPAAKSPSAKSPSAKQNTAKTKEKFHQQHAKTLSQSEYFEKKKSRGEYKTVLTKTQSEPKSTVTFEVNSQKLDLKSPSPEAEYHKRISKYDDQKNKNKPKHRHTCNIRTNPGYQAGYGSNMSINMVGSNNSSDSNNEGNDERLSKNRSPSIQRCRKSTSDLTDLTDDCNNTTLTTLSRPSSPRRRGSMKGGLAYLASRRGSRDSVCSNMSNVSNEDIGPLNFQNTVRGRQRRTSNFLELPVPDHIRPRVCSLPEKAYNPRLSDDLYRLRTFSITNKGGVVNCGDSIINRRSRSNTSVNSTASRQSALSNNGSPFDGASSCCSAYHAVDSSSPGSSPSPDCEEIPRYRVVLLGDAGVGKTALVNQFMTSEYMNTYDASLDDEFGEKTVSVLLDGEESEMIFIDHPAVEMSVENSLSTYEPHACVVVYSIVTRDSFKVAEDILNYLWRENYTQEKSVIVVGNKADLARSRVISANDGKALAVSRDCKFIETSSGIQHNVDELLVGILKQIRLRESRDKKLAEKNAKKEGSGKRKLHGSKTSLSLNIAREILQKMCLNDISKSKSCENLHVL